MPFVYTNGLSTYAKRIITLLRYGPAGVMLPEKPPKHSPQVRRFIQKLTKDEDCPPKDKNPKKA